MAKAKKKTPAPRRGFSKPKPKSKQRRDPLLDELLALARAEDILQRAKKKPRKTRDPLLDELLAYSLAEEQRIKTRRAPRDVTRREFPDIAPGKTKRKTTRKRKIKLEAFEVKAFDKSFIGEVASFLTHGKTPKLYIDTGDGLVRIDIDQLENVGTRLMQDYYKLIKRKAKKLGVSLSPQILFSFTVDPEAGRVVINWSKTIANDAKPDLNKYLDEL